MRAAIVFALVLGLGGAAAARKPAAPRPEPSTVAPAPAATPVAAPVAPPHKLIVGTHAVAPFIIKGDDGSFSGISIDLFRAVAAKLGLDYEIRELEVKDLLAAGKSGAVDVVVSMNISAEREAEMDLTHAFYSTGLAIAIKPKPEGGLLGTLKQIFTRKFLRLIGLLFAVLAVIGLLMWLAERKRNPSQFGGKPAHGIGAGLWWSAVTMTTVGYGDKSPVTIVGRLLALVWMFAAILVISSFTASISSALTVGQLASAVAGPDDLPKVAVGTVDPSSALKYLERRRITPHRTYKDAAAAMAALDRGEVDAVVYEAPILAYLAHGELADRVRVLPGTFDNHGYGFGLPEGSALREPLNRALLAYVASDEWPALLARYLGGSGL